MQRILYYVLCVAHPLLKHALQAPKPPEQPLTYSRKEVKAGDAGCLFVIVPSRKVSRRKQALVKLYSIFDTH